MKFKIHRGTQEIGGSCVEIWTDSTRIVIDFGMPLVNPDRSRFDVNTIKGKSRAELLADGILPNIPGLYEKSDHTALLLSHAHQDHYGLMKYLHSDCKVYLGRVTLKLIEITNIFTNQDWTLSNTCHFKSGVSFTFGDFEITPYLLDHSAADSYAFMVKADEKTLFYSGDFRLHGRKPGYFDWLRQNSEKNIDYLLLEGTTIGRGDQCFLTEAQIEEEFIQTFENNHGINLIYTSGQNIDRLISIYKACRKTWKTMAIDFYVATVLTELSRFYNIPHPSDNYPKLKVFYPYRLSRMIVRKGRTDLLYRSRQHKITKEQISADFKNIVMLVRPTMMNDFKYIDNLEDGCFIYSMWSGYRNDSATRKFINFFMDKGMSEKLIHTSGHADKAGLKRMVAVLRPKNIVPIHTFEAAEYEKIFTEANVLKLNDAYSHAVSTSG